MLDERVFFVGVCVCFLWGLFVRMTGEVNSVDLGSSSFYLDGL